MKTDNITHSTCWLSSLNYGELFSFDNELFLKINLDKDGNIFAVAVRNGNVVAFPNDILVVWENAQIKRKIHRKR